MVGIVERSLRIGIALAGLTVVSSAAARDAAPYFPVGMQIEAPRGFIAMCESGPALCAPSPDRTAPVTIAIGRSSEESGGHGWPFDTTNSVRLQPAAMFAIGGLGPVAGWQTLYTEPWGSVARRRPLKIEPAMSDERGPSVDAALVADPRVLQRINSNVNRNVRQVSDAVQFGQDDVWRPTGLARGAVGDCEDLALEKQIALAAAGVPPSALRLAIGYSRRAGLHTVLIARIKGGDVVLDSRTSTIRSWHRAPYVWLTVQSASDPRRWYSTSRGETLASVQPAAPHS